LLIAGARHLPVIEFVVANPPPVFCILIFHSPMTKKKNAKKEKSENDKNSTMPPPAEKRESESSAESETEREVRRRERENAKERAEQESAEREVREREQKEREEYVREEEGRDGKKPKTEAHMEVTVETSGPIEPPPSPIKEQFATSSVNREASPITADNVFIPVDMSTSSESVESIAKRSIDAKEQMRLSLSNTEGIQYLTPEIKQVFIDRRMDAVARLDKGASREELLDFLSRIVGEETVAREQHNKDRVLREQKRREAVEKMVADNRVKHPKGIPEVVGTSASKPPPPAPKGLDPNKAWASVTAPHKQHASNGSGEKGDRIMLEYGVASDAITFLLMQHKLPGMRGEYASQGQSALHRLVPTFIPPSETALMFDDQIAGGVMFFFAGLGYDADKIAQLENILRIAKQSPFPALVICTQAPALTDLMGAARALGESDDAGVRAIKRSGLAHSSITLREKLHFFTANESGERIPADRAPSALTFHVVFPVNDSLSNGLHQYVVKSTGGLVVDEVFRPLPPKQSNDTRLCYFSGGLLPLATIRKSLESYRIPYSRTNTPYGAALVSAFLSSEQYEFFANLAKQNAGAITLVDDYKVKSSEAAIKISLNNETYSDICSHLLVFPRIIHHVGKGKVVIVVSSSSIPRLMGEKSKESLLSKGVRFYVGSKRV
jgi:hypothetical protein